MVNHKQEKLFGNYPTVEPVVISASRATDIPAFHGKWLINRLRAGYCIWQNPFNYAQKQKVSFKSTRAIVFWTKNPEPFFKYLPYIEEMGYTYYFHYTVNDYALEQLEPGIPELKRRIEAFQELSSRIGSHRIIWRIDPIIMGGNITAAILLERIESMFGKLHMHTNKIVFSFLDLYRKTSNNLKKLNFLPGKTNEEEKILFANGLIKINKSLKKPLQICSCAEDFSYPGIYHNRCIDPELLNKLCPGIYDSFMPVKKVSTNASLLPGMAIPANSKNRLIYKGTNNIPKDKGQRKMCGCAPSKDIGRYNTCMHLCAYCYANYSENVVRNMWRKLNSESECL